MDSITDMLNRIRNAQAVLKETVSIPFSNLKYDIAKILENNNFVQNVEKKGRKEKKTIEIILKYEKDESNKQKKRPFISGLKRISKQGKRIYRGAKEIKSVSRKGIIIVSTSKGIMTGREAKQKGLGGEIICEVW